ncbi:MAG: CIA30 family protein [Kiritimatiellia bacterium]|jgi:hypothetical protein|nr:CIA30 family protein [Kiritimatiellia bacterium]
MKPLLALVLSALVFGSVGCTHATPLTTVPNAVSSNRTLHQFASETGTGGWQIENDAVMGGRSSSNLEINEAGNAVFSGTISLANGGGFSSIQRDFDTLDVSAYRALCLGLRGDGKRYQVRVESTPNAPNGYAFDFETSGDWQTVEIPFPELYAIHHGDRLDLPAYPGQALSRIQILAGDGRAETFVLELDRVWLIK